jgi:hypothetical protein
MFPPIVKLIMIPFFAGVASVPSGCGIQVYFFPVVRILIWPAESVIAVTLYAMNSGLRD